MKHLILSSLALCGLASAASAQAYFSFSGGASLEMPGEIQGIFSYVGPQPVGVFANLDPGPDPSFTYVGPSGDSASPTQLSDICEAFSGDQNYAPYVQLNDDAESAVALRNLSNQVLTVTIGVNVNIDPLYDTDAYNGGFAYSYMDVYFAGLLVATSDGGPVSGLVTTKINLQPESSQLFYLDVLGQGFCAEPQSTPEPGGIAALGVPLGLLALWRRRGSSRSKRR